VARCGVLSAICEGYLDGSEPAACQTDPGCDVGLQRDECGVCGGNGVMDACRVCLTPQSPQFNKSCAGCDGVPNSGLRLDACGVCGGTSTIDQCLSKKSTISPLQIVGLVTACVVVVSVLICVYMRRQQKKMKQDIDTLLKQYLPLDTANNMRNSAAETTADNARLVGGNNVDSASDKF